MANSICPEIIGLHEVKKALLLLLLDGITTKFTNGLNVREKIHVLIMGDPSVAKSLLEQFASCAPRGKYTTGKGSSRVVLNVDKGVCCIHEFD